VRFASVCSGIEAASTAWHPLGWRASWLSEIDPFACSVLAHHYPDVPNLGDMTRIGDEEIAQHDRPDVLVGGTPCQSFSVAGLRKGMADPRGNLALVFLRLLERTRARWVVWENVPGVLSSAGGRDFGAFLGALGQLGYGWAYRVLDAQYFGLAQRRKRVFVVGRAGGLTNRAAAVLFERACLRGDPAPSREAGARVAHCVAAGSGGGKFGSGRDGQDDFVVSALDCQRGGPDDNAAQAGHLVAHSLRADGFDASEDGTGRGTPIVPVGPMAFDWQSGGDMRGIDPRATAQLQRGQVPAILETLEPQGYNDPKGATNACSQEADAREVLRVLRDQVGAEAFTEWGSGVLDSLRSPEVLRAFLYGVGVRRAARQAGRLMGDGASSRTEGLPEGPVRALWVEGPDGRSPQGRELAQQLARQLGASLPILSSAGASRAGVRRLTPREAERLQGFPDDYTLVSHRGKPASDGPRYRALGNSMAVPVMAWIGKRIQLVEEV